MMSNGSYEHTELFPLNVRSSKQRYILIDEEDVPLVKKYKWHFHSTGYARTTYKGVIFYLHRLINKTPSNLHTDHINGNKLDNRKSNLRSGTQYQNQNNVHRAKGYEKVGKRYYVRIYHQNYRYDFGYYYTSQLAEHIYWSIKNQLKEAVWQSNTQ